MENDNMMCDTIVQFGEKIIHGGCNLNGNIFIEGKITGYVTSMDGPSGTSVSTQSTPNLYPNGNVECTGSIKRKKCDEEMEEDFPHAKRSK